MQDKDPFLYIMRELILTEFKKDPKFTENAYVQAIYPYKDFYDNLFGGNAFFYDMVMWGYKGSHSHVNGIIPKQITANILEKFLPNSSYQTDLELISAIFDPFKILKLDYIQCRFTETMVLVNNFEAYQSHALNWFKGSWYIIDLYIFIPEIFLFFALLLLFTYGIIFNIFNKIKFTNLFTIYIFIFTFFLYINNFTQVFDIFYFSLTSNYYIYSCRLIILFFSILFLLLILHFFKNDNIKSYEYITLYSLVIFSLLLLLGVNDFIGLFLCLELQSLSLYILASYKTTSTYSTEAGIKYFVLGAISTGIILFGISLIYGFVGTINFNDLSAINRLINYISLNTTGVFNYTDFYMNVYTAFLGYWGVWENTPLLEIPLPPTYTLLGNFNVYFPKVTYFPVQIYASYYVGFIFILVGIFFKLGVAPFHMWLPDVYEGSPTITTAFFSLIPKLSLIFLFIRLITIHLNYIGDWYFFLISCGILSILIGTFGALYQIKIKRLIAYSAISHMGFIIIGLSNFTLFNFISVFFYALVYIILNFVFFSILITLRKYNYIELKNINDLSVLIKNNTVLGVFLALNLFSIAGIPPLMGFFSKLLIFFVTINNNMWFILLIILCISMVSVFYYLRLIKILFFDINDNYTYYYPPSRSVAYLIVFGSFINIFFIIFPNIFFIEITNIIFNII